MKKEDIIELTQDELVKQIVEDKELYAKLKFNHKVAELENPMKLNHMRKDIARLLTEERKRAMAEMDAATEDTKEKKSDAPATKDTKKKTVDKAEKKAVEAKVKDNKKEPQKPVKEKPAKTDNKEDKTKDK